MTTPPDHEQAPSDAQASRGAADPDQLRIATRAVRSGRGGDGTSLAPVLYPTSTFVAESVGSAPSVGPPVAVAAALDDVERELAGR